MNKHRKNIHALGRGRTLALPSLAAFLIMGAATAAPARAQDGPPPQRMTVPLAIKPVVADGLANDLAWERGALTYGFLRTEDGEPARHGTRARALYDRRNLYFAFTAQEPAVDDVIRDARENSGSFGDRDAVGIRLQVPGDNGSEREIEIWISPANQVRVLENGERQDDTGELETGVFRREQSWDAEIVLPFAWLDVDEPQAGDVWQIDFLRRRSARGDESAETTAWNPPDGRGEIRFGRDLLVYLYSQRPFSGRDEVMVYNPSDQLRQLRAELIDAETGKVVAHETIYIGSGHRRQHFRLPAPEVGDYYVIVRQTDRPMERDDDKLVEWRPQRGGRR